MNKEDLKNKKINKLILLNISGIYLIKLDLLIFNKIILKVLNLIFFDFDLNIFLFKYT